MITKNAEEVIRLEGVVKIYRVGEVVTYGLRGVNLVVRKGELISIMGPSGSGKSTLLNMIGLLDRPTKGKILLDGIDVSKLNDKELAYIRNRKIGFVFQQFNLINRLTVLENIELPLIARGLPRHKRIPLAVKALLSVGGDKTWLYKRPNQLSGGQQQRVAIARAIAMEPSIILMDEPTSALDPELVGEVLRVIEKLARNRTTMLIVTHEMGFALRAADEIMIMDNGVIVERGSPEEILRNPKHERTKRFINSILGRVA